jgi:hypothetical protein
MASDSGGGVAERAATLGGRNTMLRSALGKATVLTSGVRTTIVAAEAAWGASQRRVTRPAEGGPTTPIACRRLAFAGDPLPCPLPGTLLP